MRLLALDPGSATGWVLWEDGDVRAWGTMTPQAMCDAIYHGQLDSEIIILERFVIHARTHTFGQAGINDALQVIGFVKWWCGHRGRRLVQQSPSERTPASDEVLKRLGWYKKNRHVRDATRHLVMFLMKEKKLRWPRRTSE